jgi:hypothetical protein
MKTPKVKKIKTSLLDRFEVANKTSQGLFQHGNTQMAPSGWVSCKLHAFLYLICCVIATP